MTNCSYRSYNPYSLNLNLHAVLADTTHASFFVLERRGQLQPHRGHCYLKANDLPVGFQSAPNAKLDIEDSHLHFND